MKADPIIKYSKRENLIQLPLISMVFFIILLKNYNFIFKISNMKHEEFSHEGLSESMKTKFKVAKYILYQKREMLHTKRRSVIVRVRE